MVDQDDDNKVIPNFDDTNKDPNTQSAKAFTAPGITPLGYICLVINRRLKLNQDRAQEDRPYVTISIPAISCMHEDI